jgi:uncharacterized Zn-finger protein
MFTELGAARVYCPCCTNLVGRVWEWISCKLGDTTRAFTARCPYCERRFRVVVTVSHCGMV